MAGFKKRFRRDDLAVTPIISTLLLITIMLTIISSILFWSIPEINRVSWTTSYRTSMSGMESLDVAMEDTVLQGVMGSTRSVRIALPDGYFSYDYSASRWLVSYSYYRGVNFEIAGLEEEFEDPEGNTAFQIYILPDRAFTVDVFWISIQNEVVSQQTFVDKEFGENMVPTQPFFLDENVERIMFVVYDHNNGSRLGEAMFIALDRLEVKIPSEFGTARIVSENGALISQFDGTSVINPPVLRYDPDGDDFYFNLVSFNVTGFRVVSAGNWEMLMRYQDKIYNSTEAYNLRLKVFSEFDDEWYRHLLGNTLFYEDEGEGFLADRRGFKDGFDNPVSGLNPVNGIMVDHRGPLNVNLVQSNVLMYLREV